jgi:cysteinyl-tRNA synthetase
MIQIYNSLTKDKQSLETIEPNKVKLYACGITVYDYAHIGHARTFIAFDVVVRYLRYCGYEVTYVRNITDVDDKIIKRSNERQITIDQLVEEFISAMHEDFDALNIERPDFEPRATESINDMISLIKKLIDKGFAYPAKNGDVYYRVGSFHEYGKLSRQNMDFLQSGSRIEIEEEKENPLDFALWKASKVDEPSWESPWSNGRPGWHIECSAMSKKTLGDTFDIHAGGSDLKFPHHENEIAQSEAGNGCTFANIWMHSGMVQINEEKMSKSLNNFFTIREVFKTHSPEVIRYFLISAHYRSELSYSEESLNNAQSALERLYRSLQEVDVSDEMPTDNTLIEKFNNAMNNDFNTPEALSILFEIAKKINNLKTTNPIEASKYALLLKSLAKILGILQNSPESFFKKDHHIDENKINILIMERQKAKETHNWEAADKIRNELMAMGVSLEDRGDKTTWMIKN